MSSTAHVVAALLWLVAGAVIIAAGLQFQRRSIGRFTFGLVALCSAWAAVDNISWAIS